MQSATIKDNAGTEYKRTNKATARKVFNYGKAIVLCPCKLFPFGGWNPGLLLDNTGEDSKDFDKLCRDVAWYNCNYDAGQYLAFYIEVEDNNAN